MSLTFVKPLEIQRPYKSFRFDAYSLKAGRRMTLYGKAALCQWLELEANSEVTAICERPLLIPDSKPKRVIDFWALEGGVSTFYLLLRNGEIGGSFPLKLAYTDFCSWVAAERGRIKEIAIDVFESRRVRLDNLLVMVEHLVSHKGQVTPELIDRFAAELPRDFSLGQAELLLSDMDPMLARAAIFHLLARGSLHCPTLNEAPLTPRTRLSRL